MSSRDNWGGWVLNCLGIWDDGDYLDKLEKDFEVDLTPDDKETIEDIRLCIENNGSYPRCGDMIARHIFDAVIEKAVDELGASASDFEYDAYGTVETEIKCKGELVETWADIVAKYPQEIDN